MAAGVSDGAVIVDTGLNNSGLFKNARAFKAAVDGMMNSVVHAGKTMSGSANGFLKGINQTAGVARELDKEIKKLEGEARMLRRSIDAGEYSEGYKALAEEIAETERQIEQLQAKQQEWADMGIAPDSAPFEELDESIFKLTDHVDALKAKQEAMRASGEAYAPGLDQLRDDYAEVQEQLEQLRASKERALSMPPGWREMATVTGAIANAMSWIKLSGATALYAMQHPAEALDRGFAAIASGAGRALAALAKFAGNGAIGFLRKLAAGAKNAAISLARLAANAARGGIKRLGGLIGGATRSMLGFNRAQKATSGGMGMSLKNVLRYGLGIRSLFVLFNRLRTAIKDGFAEMAKSNPAVKGAVDGLKASLNGLKGSLATAFAPILTAVAPALSTLIGWLTTAINAIGAFMAALTGKSSYQKAVAGLDSVGGAAGKAGGKVQDLKRQLAGFDQLEILGDKDSGGGGGGSGSGGGLTYEAEEIGGGIADWVETLKNLWAAADYDGIGRVIGEGINSAFAKARELISWDNLGEKITEGVTAITGIINGLVDGIDWDLIGRTFGTGINTLVKSINLLLDGVNWASLGAGLAEGLNGLVDEVDWDNVGELLSARMNAVITTIKGAVSNFSWADAGEAFARTVNGLLSGISWDDLTKTAADSINGIAAALRTAVNGFSWGYAGDAFARTVNGIFTGVNWDDLAKTAADSINGIIVTLRTSINGFRWDYAGEAFARTVNGLFTGVNWDNLAATAAESINGIIVTLRTSINGFSWDYAGEAFARTVNGLFTGVNWDDLGKLAADGIAKPIATLRLAVSGFDWSYAGDAFARTINGFFGNKKLWEDAAIVVSESIKGLFTWGAELLENLDAEQIATDIQTFLGSIDWDGIAQAIWRFAVSAVRKLGNLFLALIFGPDYKDKTKVQQEIEDYVSGLTVEPTEGRNYTVDFGLNLYADTEADAFEQLWKAIDEALKSGDWHAPVNLDVPEESVEAARQEFIREWNLAHPEAPIDPTLPADAGTQIHNEWNGQKPRLPAPVHMVKDTTGAQTTEALYSTADKAVIGKVSLTKDGWTTIAAFVGTAVTVLTSLGKDGWTSIEKYVGTAVRVLTALKKDGWSSIGAFVGTNVTVKTGLKKKGWSTISKYVGTSVTVKTNLTNRGSNWTTGLLKWLTGDVRGVVTMTVNLVAGIATGFNLLFGGKTQGNPPRKAAGGVITPGGRSLGFASGGMLTGAGRPRWWSGVQKYASGTTRAHGTLFAAGEAGPEIVGHINGRTEILNRSQLAQTMYGAVASGMLYALSKVRLSLPAVSTGGAVPYQVAAQVAASGAAIEETLNANNEDLIQTIVSVAGQIVAAIQRQQRSPARGGDAVGVTAKQVIDEINRRTQMFGVSPLI